MKIIVTGSAGFIGSSLSNKLLIRGDTVIGIDNMNDYYDPELKKARKKHFLNHKNYTHFYSSLENKKEIDAIFKLHKPDVVVNLAAQAGVRYSIEKPLEYVNTNLVGFANILEGSRNYGTKHLVFASSSSVYGSNVAMPFSVKDNVDHPLSLYAATKKSNEYMSHTYSHLFGLPTTGLRFFTVYGPWGRPDMALFKFTKGIIEGKPIDVFNYGNHKRDFTYIDDIVEGVIRVIDNPARPNKNWQPTNPEPDSSDSPYRIYNIGNSNPVELMQYIKAIEISLGKEAIKNFLPLQQGDVPDTYADTSEIENDLKYKPSMKVELGVKNFVDWYLDFYNINK